MTKLYQVFGGFKSQIVQCYIQLMPPLQSATLLMRGVNYTMGELKMPTLLQYLTLLVSNGRKLIIIGEQRPQHH